MANSTAWAEIERALRQVGFERDWTATACATYRGFLNHSQHAFPASLEIENLDFVTAPVVRLADIASLGRVAPHVLGPDGVLCYLDPRAQVLDRYSPGPTVLRCVEIAEKVVREAAAGRSDADFAEEFANYWGGDFVYVDLPSTADSGDIAWVSLRNADDPATGILTAPSGLAEVFLARHRQVRGTDTSPSAERCAIIDVDQALTVDPRQSWPPKTFPDLCAWLDVVAPGTTLALERRISIGEGTSRLIGLRAANGLFLFRIAIPLALRRPEFLTTRRTRLFHILRQGLHQTRVERISARRIDADYLFARNLPEGRGLQRRKIALIGCGSIGGYLADQLVRSGAGTGGGRLDLYDPDILLPNNLGRHLLGLNGLGRNKAAALCEHLRSEVPHLTVRAHPRSALSAIDALECCDMVIDATGEEAFSIALNQRLVMCGSKTPAVLYLWLVGDGVAAEALLWEGLAGACYKCLKPELSGQQRFRLLRPEFAASLRRNHACGDTLYTPYPASRASGAAGLGLDVVLDWAAKAPGPRHRTRVFEPLACFKVKDSDPAPSQQCPACRLTP